jgi:CheY-like chemotaxis protein
MSDQSQTDDLVASAVGVVETRPSNAFCLIVDDEKGIRSVLARSLRKLMIMTEECGDASSAIAVLKRRTPDLIFLDVSLERSAPGDQARRRKVFAQNAAGLAETVPA